MFGGGSARPDSSRGAARVAAQPPPRPARGNPCPDCITNRRRPNPAAWGVCMSVCRQPPRPNILYMARKTGKSANLCRPIPPDSAPALHIAYCANHFSEIPPDSDSDSEWRAATGGVKADPVAARDARDARDAPPLAGQAARAYQWPGKQPAPTSGRPLQHCRAMFDARNSPALRPAANGGRPLEGVKPPAISPAP